MEMALKLIILAVSLAVFVLGAISTVKDIASTRSNRSKGRYRKKLSYTEIKNVISRFKR